MDIETRPTRTLNNYYAWGIALLPLLASIPPEEYYSLVVIISIVALIALVIADNRTLNKSGYTPPLPAWGILVVPVYLWKRANVTGSKKILVVIWVAAVALSFLVDNFNHKSSITETACPLVTNIIKEHLGDDAAQCVKVKITEKVTDYFYKGTATLNNGNDITISIEEKDGMIYVRVPSMYLQ